MSKVRRTPLSLRTTADLREALNAAAARNGRSLTQEVEFRLEASLTEDRMRQLIYQALVGVRVSQAHNAALRALAEQEGDASIIRPNMSDADYADWLHS